MTSSSLTSVVPIARPVPFRGTVLLVPPLRLRDCAQLQAWLEMVVPCPFDEVLPRLDGADGESRRRLLRDAYLACEQWPVRFGTPAAHRLLESELGSRFYLGVLLDRAVPRPTAEDLDWALADSGSIDWRRLASVAFGTDPLESLLGLIEPAIVDDDVVDDCPNWPAMFAEIAAETGWTFEAIADLTLSQWVALRFRGERAAGLPPRPGESYLDAAKRRHNFFRGDHEAMVD